MQFTIQADVGLVRCWSDVRLPFEPKGEQLIQRNAIREAIQQAFAPGSGNLHAVFSSEDRARADIENVLLYNVGAALFRTCASKSLWLERDFRGPAPTQDGRKYRFLSEYRDPELHTTIPFWRATRELVQFKSPARNGLPTNASDAWWWMKQADTTLKQRATSNQLALVATIRGPANRHINLAEKVKVLVDGITAALHHHPEVPGYLVERLGWKVDQPPELLAELLADSQYSVLGSRPLIHAFGESFAWNPADEWLQQIRLRYEATDQPGYRLWGALFEVEPAD
jgi:hypothetical protein